MATFASSKLDTADLENKVKAMYRAVAQEPDGEFHFEMGRGLAERLGYEKGTLDRSCRCHPFVRGRWPLLRPGAAERRRNSG